VFFIQRPDHVITIFAERLPDNASLDNVLTNNVFASELQQRTKSDGNVFIENETLDNSR
jgi:hypothetical protein